MSVYKSLLKILNDNNDVCISDNLFKTINRYDVITALWVKLPWENSPQTFLRAIEYEQYSICDIV